MVTKVCQSEASKFHLGIATLPNVEVQIELMEQNSELLAGLLSKAQRGQMAASTVSCVRDAMVYSRWFQRLPSTLKQEYEALLLQL